MYTIDFTEKAIKDLAKLKKDEPDSFRKASKLLAEIAEHPETGTGQPEQLKNNLSGCWSRRITLKHRIIKFSGGSCNCSYSFFIRTL